MKLARDLNPESSWVVGHNGRPDDENAAAALINFVALAAGASDRSLIPWFMRGVRHRADPLPWTGFGPPSRLTT